MPQDQPPPDRNANSQQGSVIPTTSAGRGFLFPLVVIVIAIVLMVGYFVWGWRVRPRGLPSEPATAETAAPNHAATDTKSATADTGSRAAISPLPHPSAAATTGKKSPASASETKRAGIGLQRIVGQPVDAQPSSVEALVTESKQVVECLTDAFPSDPDAHEVAARLYFRLGDTQDAERLWKLCLQLNPKFAYAYDGLGRAAAKRGDDSQAITLFRKALAINPNAVDTQIELAQALIDTNQMEDAIRLLETNVRQDPRRYRGYVLLGMAYMHLEDYAKARSSYQAALDAFPEHANACFGLATACARAGDTAAAKKYMARFRALRAGERKIGTEERNTFDDLQATCIDTAASYTAAARVCLVHHDPVDTELLCRRAAALDPKNVECRQALAWLYSQGGKPDKTIAIFHQLMKLDPNNMRYPLQIANIQASTGHPAQAERFLRGVVESAPNSAAGCVAMANFLLRQNTKLDEVVTLARKATRLDKSAANFVLLSTALERSGDVPGALEAMAFAIERDPKNPRYQQAYAALKKKYEQ